VSNGDYSVEGCQSQNGNPRVGKRALRGLFPIFLLPDPIQNIINQAEGTIIPRVELTLPLPEEKLLLDSFLFDLVPEKGNLFGSGKPARLVIGIGFWSLFLPFRLFRDLPPVIVPSFQL